jgi:hypothetical protein
MKPCPPPPPRSYMTVIKKVDVGVKWAILTVNGESKGEFFGFFLFMYDIQHCFICRPSDSTVSEDAGIEPRTVVKVVYLPN